MKHRKPIFIIILICILIIFILSVYPLRPYVTNENSGEEICLAIQNEYFMDRCLAYVKEDSVICRNVGCYALARKLRDGSICTTNSEDATKYWGRSETGQSYVIKKITNEFCREFAEMDDAEYQEKYQDIVDKLSDPYLMPDGPREPKINISRAEILSQTVDVICNLDEQDCYGTCQVSKARCISAVALVKEDPGICWKMVGRVGFADVCYHAMAFIINDVEICNFARGYTRDECYLDYVTKGIHYVYTRLNDDRYIPISED